MFVQQEMNKKHSASGRNIARLMRQREVKVGIMNIIFDSVGHFFSMVDTLFLSSGHRQPQSPAEVACNRRFCPEAGFGERT